MLPGPAISDDVSTLAEIREETLVYILVSKLNFGRLSTEVLAAIPPGMNVNPMSNLTK
jgi:hypothetical protein